ncbi:MAG: hypothetical protein HW384_138 [Dehalococcoidia bacterium]|nr:hypothetical protein [Dehalococcoidia bacterium]
MKRQFGFTLVESVVSLAIVVIVATGASSTVFYIFKANNKAQSILPSIHNIQIAGRWLSRDVQVTNRTSLVDGALPIDLAITPVDFYRTDYYVDPPVSSTITYTLAGGELRRNYDGQITTIARGIPSVAVSITGRIVTIAISSEGQAKTYNIYLRPSWD